MTLGKFTKGTDSYIARAGTDSTYFDMGEQWNVMRDKYGLTNKEMFDYFNVPALDNAISQGKTIKFSHDPSKDRKFLGQEWEYIKTKLGVTDADLYFEGGFWYVR